MTKIHFRPYNPNQTVLFPPRIDEDIAEHDPVRMVDALVESLNLESFRKLYKECGRSPYHPRMMLKVILYAYMNNIYSCRKIEKLHAQSMRTVRGVILLHYIVVRQLKYPLMYDFSILQLK